MIRTVIGSFDSADDADRATRDLRSLGFPDSDINLVVSNVGQGDAETELPVVGDAGNIEHLFSCVHVQRADQQLPHHEQAYTDPMEIPGGPHPLLPFSDLAKILRHHSALRVWMSQHAADHA